MDGIFWGLIGLVIGGLFGFYIRTYSNETRPRRGERPVAEMRDRMAIARAYAFEDMYKNYANPMLTHHLTAEEIEDVKKAVRIQLSGQFGGQGDLLACDYLNLDYDAHIEHYVQTSVTEAMRAFLSI